MRRFQKPNHFKILGYIVAKRASKYRNIFNIIKSFYPQTQIFIFENVEKLNIGECFVRIREREM
jgi:hypothetical protein